MLRFARFRPAANSLLNSAPISSIPPNVAARRCSPRSVVCQRNSRTRSWPRHAASAPAAATAAAVAAVLLLLLCICNLLVSSAVFLGAPLSLNCYCADTSITVHATDGFSTSVPLLSFVTFFAVSTHLHDSSDSSYQRLNLTPCHSLRQVVCQILFAWDSPHFYSSHPAATNTLTARVESFRDLFSTLSLSQRWSQSRLARGVVTPKSAIIDCIPSPSAAPVTTA